MKTSLLKYTTDTLSSRMIILLSESQMEKYNAFVIKYRSDDRNTHIHNKDNEHS